MKKILILANNAVGLYNFRFELIKQLLKLSYEIYLSLPESAEDEKVKLMIEAGAKHTQTYINRRGIYPFEDLKLIKDYKRIIKEVNPDVVLTYTIKPNIYGTYAARGYKKPVIMNITGIGTSLTNSKLKHVVSRLYKFACKKARLVFFQNESNYSLFISNKIIDHNKTKIIPGSGVNIDKFKPMDKKKKDGIIRFLFIGRIMKEKGIEEYLEVANNLTNKYSNIKFYILGPFEEEKYKDAIFNNKNPRIKYLGISNDVRNEIKEADCIVNPSYHEGMSNVLLESASMGKPLIASNIPGCKEITEDGYNGYLFEVKSAVSLEDKIIRFIELDTKEKEIMGKNSRKKVKAEFDRNIVINEYMKAINDILNRGGDKMSLYESIKSRKEKISVIGLGYVGMPLAIAFAKKADVIGFDINKEKVEQYLKEIDLTNEVGNEALKETAAFFTWEEKYLKECKFHIVAVPTPINPDNTPNLNPVISASIIVGRNLTKGSIVVLESTVYPGVTEDVCVPILEEESGLKCGVDFKVGYSPERINPGDKVHRLETIVKVVSGMDEESLEEIAKVYEMVIDAGVHRAESIKVAEAAKVIENSQRDINIAFMNELSIIFNKLGIDTKAVLKAAGTKWNFLKFTPGLVGGHCIGVDPYYLTYKAEELGYYSQIILSGRKINDDMGKYVAGNTVKKMIKANKQINGSKVAIFGVTFKENCPDVRNTKVVDVIKELEEYGIEVKVVDPVADKEDLWHEYRINLCNTEEIKDMDAVIFAVAHKEFISINLEDIKKMYRATRNYSDALEAAAASEVGTLKNDYVLIDVKGMFNRKEAEDMNYLYWRL